MCMYKSDKRREGTHKTEAEIEGDSVEEALPDVQECVMERKSCREKTEVGWEHVR